MTFIEQNRFEHFFLFHLKTLGPKSPKIIRFIKFGAGIIAKVEDTQHNIHVLGTEVEKMLPPTVLNWS